MQALFFVTEVDVDATHPDGPRQVFYKDKGGLGRSLAEIAHKVKHTGMRAYDLTKTPFRWRSYRLKLYFSCMLCLHLLSA